MGTTELEALQAAKANLELLIHDIEEATAEKLDERKITAAVIRRKIEGTQCEG